MHTLRRRPDHEMVELLCRRLASMAVAVSTVCGSDNPTTRLVTRAAYGPATDVSEKLRQLRLARYELDRLAPGTQRRVRSLAERLSEQDPSVRDCLLEHDTAARPAIAVALESPSRIDTVAATLQPYGFHVYAADSALLQRFDSDGADAPALVIMDLLEQDGDRIALALVARRIPVIILCGIPAETSHSWLSFLQREFEPDQLMSEVFRALG